MGWTHTDLTSVTGVRLYVHERRGRALLRRPAAQPWDCQSHAVDDGVPSLFACLPIPARHQSERRQNARYRARTGQPKLTMSSLRSPSMSKTLVASVLREQRILGISGTSSQA